MFLLFKSFKYTTFFLPLSILVLNQGAEAKSCEERREAYSTVLSRHAGLIEDDYTQSLGFQESEDPSVHIILFTCVDPNDAAFNGVCERFVYRSFIRKSDCAEVSLEEKPKLDPGFGAAWD